jgi:signal peptide peptidase SppA
MQILDVLTAPWAIAEDKLIEIRSIYAAHTRGEKIDVEAVEARLGRSLSNDDQGFTINSGVAIIPIHGVMAKKMNMFNQISGGASTQLIARDIQAAVIDPNVNSIMLHIDSPGGTIDGTETLAGAVSAASDIKPVVSFVDGAMASAAYWVGSAADQIVASSSTSNIGSIGVVATHTDTSKMEEESGVKITEISAGKYKRITSRHAPLTDDGKAEIQAQVDQLYTIFVDNVAENRGVDVDTVLEDMADGRVFLSKQAKKRGLIDEVASFEETILNMSNGVWPMVTKAKAQTEPVAAVEQMTVEALTEKHPDIAQALIAQGATAERERIQACEAASLPGHEKLVDSMKYDGKSQDSDVALAIVGEERKFREKHLKDFTGDAPKVVPLAAVPEYEKPTCDDKSMPIDERAKASWDTDKKIRDEFVTFDGYLAFMKADEAQKIKVHGTK